MTKPNRLDTAELALLDIPTRLTHPITSGANILSYTTTPTAYGALYITRVPGGHAFYRLDVRTGQSQFMMIDPTQAITPTISPDGSRMVYDNFSTRTLYLMDMVTLRSQQLVRHGGVSLALPDWSPDNESLVFAMQRADQETSDLLILNLDTMERRWITDTRESEAHPRYSPDGSQLVYRVVRGARHALVIQQVATGDVETVYTTDDNLWGPDWSADGESIVFQITREHDSNLYMLHRESGSVRQLIQSPGWHSNPIWMAGP